MRVLSPPPSSSCQLTPPLSTTAPIPPPHLPCSLMASRSSDLTHTLSLSLLPPLSSLPPLLLFIALSLYTFTSLSLSLHTHASAHGGWDTKWSCKCRGTFLWVLFLHTDTHTHWSSYSIGLLTEDHWVYWWAGQEAAGLHWANLV